METWGLLTDIPEECYNPGQKLYCFEDKVYLVGDGDPGFQSLDYKSISEYNPRTKTWRFNPSLYLRRTYDTKYCIPDKNRFIFHNYYNKSYVMCYDDKSDGSLYSERFVSGMNRVVEVRGKIYAVSVLGGVELFDLDTSKWTTITDVPNRRVVGTAVAVLNNKIYLTGGTASVMYCEPDSRVDCYDPDTNTWTRVANMNIGRRGHSLVSLHGKLYAIGGAPSGYYAYGGDGCNRSYEDSGEVYDPDSNTWTLLECKLDGKALDSGVGLLKKYLTM